MEMEMKDELGLTVDRLAAAANLLEQTVERLAQRQSAFAEDAEASISRIVATVEARREAELEEKLAAAEGVTVDSLEAGSLDAALVSLSLEQRIAVKSQLMRAGLLG
jgi:hypothetical protein